MTKEQQEEKNRREHPEDYVKVEMYLEEEFKNYVRDKYPHESG